MAKAAARVNPQYVYCENPIFCKNLSESLQRVVEDFVKGKSNGTAAKKADLKTYILCLNLKSIVKRLHWQHKQSQMLATQPNDRDKNWKKMNMLNKIHCLLTFEPLRRAWL